MVTLKRESGGEVDVALLGDHLSIKAVRHLGGQPLRLYDAPYILTREATRELAELLSPLVENRRLEADNALLVKGNKQLEKETQRLESEVNRLTNLLKSQHPATRRTKLLNTLYLQGIDGDVESARLYFYQTAHRGES